MSRHVLSAFILLPAIVALPSIVHAQTEESFNITVRNSFSEEALEGVVVKLLQDGLTLGETTTDQQGRAQFSVTVVGTDSEVPQSGYTLGAPFPNPSNGRVSIPLVAERPGLLTATLYDALGRAVTSLDRSVGAGTSTFEADLAGLPPGSYFLTVRYDGLAIGSAQLFLIESGRGVASLWLSERGLEAPTAVVSKSDGASNEYQVRFAKAGYVDQERTVTLPDDLTLDAWLHVDPSTVTQVGLAVFETGHPNIPGIAAHEDGTVMIAVSESILGRLTSAILVRHDSVMVVFFDENGLPERAYVDETIVLFENYRDNLVDLAIIPPNGGSVLVRAVDIGDFINGVASGKLQAAAEWLRALSVGLSIATCGTAIAASRASAGIAVPLAASACGSLALKVVAIVAEHSDNEAIRLSGAAIGTVGSLLGCAHGSLTDCESGALDIAVTIIELEEDVREERADEIEAATAQLLQPGGDTITNTIGMHFTRIPAGAFEMGSTNGGSDERPVHSVTISRDFYIGTYEVTQGQWQAVTGSNPSHFGSCGADCPVETVTWFDVIGFANALSSAEGMSPCYDSSGNVIGGAGGDVYMCTGYRLPTEAEWEYAVRAGTTTEYSFGDDAGQLGQFGWYRENSSSTTHPVGQKQPNPWGLYDVHGNVWEWVHDWYSSSYYGSSPASDPSGPSTGSVGVFRGGGWGNGEYHQRSAVRGRDSPGDDDDELGFRLLRTAN
ncbi:MAG TPA: SUMF1/EgtB/PvdO family nonheme iron enzyme [Rhodothermales bacterium]|nr:SUMF1/EgtB/PvdO family nonheme iron enzyme [Rhodothermales bacterium]